MSTTFAELRRQVLLRMPSVDGKTVLAVEQSINDAQKVIAMVKDFDDLMVLDTANAATTANQATYNLTSNLGLTRPKDIYTIRYMANDESRKLTFVPIAELDRVVPYTLGRGTGKPTHYTRRGATIELFPVPDAASNLYIQHSQWPATLANETDETPFQNIDIAIVDLAVDMALAIINGTSGEWVATEEVAKSVGAVAAAVADIPTPASATAEDCANKINALLASLRAAGLLAP